MIGANDNESPSKLSVRGLNETGFHIFCHREDAEQLFKAWEKMGPSNYPGTRNSHVHVLAKVKYRKAVVEGDFDCDGAVVDCDTIVAKEIFIEEILEA